MLTREPLVIRGAIVAAVTALIHVLVVAGALPITPDVEGAVALAVDLIGTAVLVVWTRGKVTPVDAPNVPIPEGTGTRRDVELPDVSVDADDAIVVITP